MQLDTKSFLIQSVLILEWLLMIHSASIDGVKRTKRGILSRTGLCPSPVENFHTKDNRLNYFGLSYFLSGDETPPCTAQECTRDSHCGGDQKCCRNYCGAMICTEAVRDPHPCEMFQCPVTKICKIQRVKCIDPNCPDMLAVARPICVPGGPIYEIGKRSRIPRPNIMAYNQQQTQKGERSSIPTIYYSPQQPYYRSRT